MAPERPQDPREFTPLMNDVLRRLREVERHRHPLQDIPDVPGAAGGKEYATVVVAAADTHESGKATADFVCTGTGDEATLTTALATMTIGGEMVLLEGTYVFDDVWTIDQSEIHIRGMGQGTRLDAVASGTNPISITADNVILSHMAILGAALFATGVDAGTAARTSIIGCYLSNFITGISVGTESIVSRCFVSGGSVGVTTGAGCRVTDNFLTTQDMYGIETSVGTNPGATVANNTIVSPSIGIQVSGDDTVVSGNTIRLPSDTGINLTSRSVAVGNRIEGSSSSTAVGIESGGDSIIVGNVIRTVRTGILLNNLGSVAEGNILRDCRREGIKASSSTDANGVNYVIANNFVFGCGTETNNTYDGILLETRIDKANVQGNTVRRGATANRHRYGINIANANCNDNLVTNNDLSDSGTTGSLNDAGTGTITAAGNRL